MHVLQYFQRKLTSEKFDAKAGQVACWMVSGFILVSGIFKVTAMQLSEPQLFFGILLVLSVALLGVVLGILLPIAQFVEQRRKDNIR